MTFYNKQRSSKIFFDKQRVTSLLNNSGRKRMSSEIREFEHKSLLLNYKQCCKVEGI
jgi:hypothetical protein